MIKNEKVILDKGCLSVSICRRSMVKGDFKSYCLFFYSYFMGDLVSDKFINFENEEDLNKRFNDYLDVYLLDGYE